MKCNWSGQWYLIRFGNLVPLRDLFVISFTRTFCGNLVATKANFRSKFSPICQIWLWVKRKEQVCLEVTSSMIKQILIWYLTTPGGAISEYQQNTSPKEDNLRGSTQKGVKNKYNMDKKKFGNSCFQQFGKYFGVLVKSDFGVPVSALWTSLILNSRLYNTIF